jgi:ABC-type multidrug transport system permease subunit
VNKVKSWITWIFGIILFAPLILVIGITIGAILSVIGVVVIATSPIWVIPIGMMVAGSFLDYVDDNEGNADETQGDGSGD